MEPGPGRDQSRPYKPSSSHVAAWWTRSIASLQPILLTRSRLIVLACWRMPQIWCNEASSLYNLLQIYTGLNAYAVQHIEQIFGCKVASSAGSVGAAAQASRGGIDNA